MFGLAVHSLIRDTPTFDEQGFITRGVGYLRGQNRHMRVGHPLGLNALNAAFLAGDPAVRLPTQDPSWQETNFHRPSELFLWEIGNDVAQVMFLARLPTVFLGLLLAALAGRWAWELTGRRPAGLLALSLVALDPNILAHTHLATTDLGLAAGAALAGYTLWRALKQPSWGRAAVAGAAFGLLQNSKFTAGLFAPLFGLVIGVAFLTDWRLYRRFMLPLAVIYPLAAFLALWAAYGFDVGTLPDSLPTFNQLAGRTLPLAHHLEQLLDLGGRMQKSTPAFLLGDYSDEGWWYYFPVAFLLKTPLPTLILLGWAGYLQTRRLANLQTGDVAALLIPAGGYFAIALTSDINLGYRHLLPVLPFLAVFIAGVLLGRRPSNTPAAWLLAGWLALATVAIAPHFLAFFNVLAGGPDNGWRALVDSNLDWGQDLGRLKQWMRQNNVEHVWLSYFGEARPEYYGISYTGLASSPPRLMNPAARPFYPHDPAPGVYAISATTLQGVHFDDHDLFAWFRERELMAKVGYSIFIYEVAPRGEPVALALAGGQLDEIAPADYALLGSNQIVPRWFNPEQALLLPGETESWLAFPQGVALPPALGDVVNELSATTVTGESVTLYHLRPDAAARLPGALAGWELDTPAAFSQGDGRLALNGFYLPGPATDGSLVLFTVAQQLASPRPVKMFVHLQNSGGELISQWDGLGALWEGWREGDTLVQMHLLSLPAGVPAATYELWAGFYHPETLERWRAPAGDRLLVGTVSIP